MYVVLTCKITTSEIIEFLTKHDFVGTKRSITLQRRNNTSIRFNFQVSFDSAVLIGRFRVEFNENT